MKYVAYPGRGRPPALTQDREELVMLLQASIEIANAERWALEIGDIPPPAALTQTLRTSAYEVTVVDVLHRVARRYFEQRVWRAVWERAFPTGRQGRPEAVDISLFDEANATETRLELGLYSFSKLKSDCEKLVRLAPSRLNGFDKIESLVLLWQIEEVQLVKATPRNALETLRSDARRVFTEDSGHSVVPLFASSVDLFVAKSGASRCATAALFELHV